MADCFHCSVFSYKDFFVKKEERAEDLEATRTSAQQGKVWGAGIFGEAG